MNDDIIQDLKQFIAATISQQTADIVARLDGVDQRLDRVDARLEKVDQRLDRVETKIDDLSGSVAEALENSNQATDEQLKDHEQRITRLEQKAA
jgi:DNA anti-recombination protein RmuC